MPLSNPPLSPIVLVKTANQAVNNSTVMVNCTDLVLPVAASESWHILCILRFIRGAGAQTTKFAFTVPAGGSLMRLAAISLNTQEADLVGSSVSGTGTAADPAAIIFIEAIYKGAAAAGSCQLQFAQSTAEAVDHTVEVNSLMICNRLQ